ncbi:MAG: hypothetical protein H7251_14815 [Acetobacteraceae bacterium]|nr:hypothetical protein [Acetobacteraceae bacterium]
MRIILLLIIVVVGGAWFYPQYAEDTSNGCAAFEKKLSGLMQAESKKILPGQRGNDPRVNALFDAMKTVVASSNGLMAEAYIKDKFPQLAQLPPSIGCVAGYWKLTFDPDLTQYMKGKLGAKP